MKSRHLPRLMSMIESAGDECVMWDGPANRSGYAHITVNYKTVMVHAIACEYRHGPRPTGLVAAHHCGCRLCVNPHHIRWTTQKDNIADQIRHGTRLWGQRHYKAILSDAQILQAVDLIAGGMSVCAVARQFGVSRNAIRGRVETLGSRFDHDAKLVVVELVRR